MSIRQSLAARLRKGYGMHPMLARRVVTILISLLAKEIMSRGRLAVAGFGTFKIITRPARTRTLNGTAYVCPERRTIVFRPTGATAKALRLGPDKAD
jgi:nucleoid DNA-binding protein